MSFFNPHLFSKRWQWRMLLAPRIACRQQAAYNPAQSWHLLGQAERREHLAQDELDAHFKACNTARSSDLAKPIPPAAKVLLCDRLGGFQRAEGRAWNIKHSWRVIPGHQLRETTMKLTTIAVASILAFSSTLALAQSGGAGGSGGSTGASSGGSSGSTASGAGTTGSSAGTSSSYVNGTGGSPGPNTSDALSHGTAGNSMGGINTSPSTSSGTPGGK